MGLTVSGSEIGGALKVREPTERKISIELYRWMASGANPGTGKQIHVYYFNFMLFVAKKRHLPLFVYIHLYNLAILVWL